jgi:hypothetical protein
MQVMFRLRRQACQAIAVAGDNDDFEIGSRQLEAGGKRQRPPVSDVKGIGVDIGAEPARASDAGNEGQPVLVDIELVDRPQQRAQGDTVTASRAQEMREHVFTQVIVDIELLLGLTHGRPAPVLNSVFAAALWFRRRFD